MIERVVEVNLTIIDRVPVTYLGDLLHSQEPLLILLEKVRASPVVGYTTE